MNDLQLVPASPAIYQAPIKGEFLPFETPAKKIDRETWLNAAAVIMISEKFDTLEYLDGYKWPVPYRLSVGHIPGTRIVSNVLGCCIQSIASATGHCEIFITPYGDDSLKICATLIHELVHASEDNASGHATHGHFGKVARGIGLEGPLTATHAGPELVKLFDQIIESLGPIPHGAINLSGQPNDGDKPGKKGGSTAGPRPSTGGKKPSTGSRMKKVECSGCGWSFRTSQKNIDAMTSSTCLSCGENQLASV